MTTKTQDAPSEVPVPTAKSIPEPVISPEHKSEIVYRGGNGLIVATVPVRNYKGLFDPGHYYVVGTEEKVVDYTHFQMGPVPIAGVNGTTNEAQIAIIIHRTETLNRLFPCPENERAIEHLKFALGEFEARTRARQERGVEGQYKA